MISNYAEAGQSINITAALDNYFTYCAPYFAYAILCYGLGVVMGKLTNLTHVMSLCLESTQEEKKLKNKYKSCSRMKSMQLFCVICFLLEKGMFLYLFCGF